MQAPQTISGELDFILLIYAGYLIITGRPFFLIRMRRWSSWWPDLQSKWFQIAGGVYLSEFLLFLFIPGIPYEIDIVFMIIAGILFLIGVCAALQKPIY